MSLNENKQVLKKKLIKYITIILLAFPSYLVSAQVSDTLVYAMDTTESYLAWNCDSHHGTVPIKSGSLKTLNNNIVSGSFVVKMDSIKDLDIAYPLMRHTLENTLRSEFFFDVNSYSTAEFNIDYTIPLNNNKQLIAGDLWIKGLVNCIKFNSSINLNQKELIAVSDSFQINRINWNITIYSKQEAKSDESVIVSDSIGFVVHLKGYKTND